MDYPLHEAAGRGQLGELMRLLVLGTPGQAGGIHARNGAGETLLHAAVRSGRLDVVILALCNGAEINAKTSSTPNQPGGETPLHLACALGNVPLTRHLLVSGADSNARTNTEPPGAGGETPLHVVSRMGNLGLVQTLLENGAGVDIADGLGMTPLHVAAGEGHLGVVRELVARGAKVDIESRSRMTPLALAKAQRHPEVVAFLSQHSLSPDVPTHVAEPSTEPVRPVLRAEPQRLDSAEPPVPEVPVVLKSEAVASVVPSATESASKSEPAPPETPGVSVEPRAVRDKPRTIAVVQAVTAEPPKPGLPVGQLLMAEPPPLPPERGVPPPIPPPLRPDPTVEWAPFRPPIPDFDVAKMRFGSLRFGDGIRAASFLGRPDWVEWGQNQRCVLLYAAGGFQLEFERNRFSYLAFFLGPDPCLLQHARMQFSRPRLRGCKPSGAYLSSSTDQEMLERLFGEPDSVDEDDQEAILHFFQHGIRMECELDGRTGRLKRWNLYLP